MAGHRSGMGNFVENSELAAEAGIKDGYLSDGNFKNSLERASEAGRKGGLIIHKGRSGSATS